MPLVSGGYFFFFNVLVNVNPNWVSMSNAYRTALGGLEV